MSAANSATKISENKVMVRRKFIVPLGSCPWFLPSVLERPAYFPTGRKPAAPESSAKICRNAATQAVPFPSARRAWSGRWFSGPGDYLASRAASCRSADRSFFTRPEAGRIRHTRNRQILRMDIRLVSAHRHRGKRCLLLRAFRRLSHTLWIAAAPNSARPRQLAGLDGVRVLEGKVSRPS